MTSEGHDTKSATASERRALKGVIVRDLLNITWRMLVPTMVGIGLGMVIDSAVNTSPVGFLIGALAGFITGIALALQVLHKARELGA